jgi:DNA repair protein RadD
MTKPVPRRHQAEAVSAAEEAFRAGIKRVVWDMCVGAGKSLAYALASYNEIARGGRVLAVAPNRELVQQMAAAFRSLDIPVGINCAALGERVWRGPAIIASINSVHSSPQSFGPISLLIEDEAHMAPHGQQGMLRSLRRGLGDVRVIGGTGTPYRMYGGSIVDGEDAPYQQISYRYHILDGIRDGYLVPPYSAEVDDKLDVSKVRVSQGEYTGASQDAQMIAMMDNHIAQMLHYGRDRRSWLVFEASRKAAIAMAARMNEWGIPTGLVLGDRTRAEAAHRQRTVEAFRAGQLRAVVNVDCLTTGFDVQQVDMLVCRRRTKSLSLWVQIVGRLLRTIGGNLDASIAAGKADGLLLDFSDNTSEFGPLDFIRPKETKSKLVSCESCGKRNAGAAMKCWACDAPMTKNCPACLQPIQKGLLDCPLCGHDMRVGGGDEEAAPKGQKLLERPSGAALIASYKPGAAREGGWSPVRRVWEQDGVVTLATESGQVTLPEAFAAYGKAARWIRCDAEGAVDAVLIPNGSSRTSVLQVTIGAAGVVQLPVPMPSLIVA